MKNLLYFLILFFISHLNTALAENRLIISGHPDYPPVMWKENEKIVGVGPDLAARVFNELGVAYEIRFSGPWKRVQENARSGEIDFIVGIYSNDERKTYLDFTVPYMTDPNSIFVMKNKTFHFDKWEDLIGKKGLTMHGESFGVELDRFIDEKLSMHKAYDVNTIFKLLETGRSDYILWGYYPFLIHIVQTGYKDRIIPLPKNVTVENMYMAFSKKSKYLHLLPEVNRLILKFKAQGQIDQWVKKHLNYFETK